MSESIYILGYSIGEYSDRREETICAFRNESEADSICEKLEEIQKFANSINYEIYSKSRSYRESLPQIAHMDGPKIPPNWREYAAIKAAWEEENKLFLKAHYASQQEVHAKTSIYTTSLWKETFDSKPEYKDLFIYYDFIDGNSSALNFYVIKTELK